MTRADLRGRADHVDPPEKTTSCIDQRFAKVSSLVKRKHFDFHGFCRLPYQSRARAVNATSGGFQAVTSSLTASCTRGRPASVVPLRYTRCQQLGCPAP